MEFSLTRGSLEKQRTGCIVVGVFEGGKLSSSAARIDAASNQALTALLAQGDVDGKPGSTLLLHRPPQLDAERVLVVGLGSEHEFGETRYRAALFSAMATLRTTGATKATLCLNELPVDGRDAAWKIEQAVRVANEALYRFDRLKSQPEPRPALQQLGFHIADGAQASECEAALARAAAIAEGIALARDLGNLPGNICTPTYLAHQASELGARHGWKTEILERDDIARLGMNGFLAVARGSREPPRLIVMEVQGASSEAQPPIVLVGKGITFDSGGLCIKPAPEMDEMKFDMCGAAAVFGALHAAALMKLPLHLVGIVPATENMPDGNAIKPGDVVTTLSGQTVEVIDTDSEGRLVLCDALTYAEKFAPAVVVDVATLTGTIVNALGDVATGVFSSSDALAREVVAAGEEAWDRAWQMPLWDEYQDVLKSNFADLPNIGSHADCAVTSACFLSRFTTRYPWVHLDIAGTASKSGAEKGATGRPVALLAHFLASRVRS